MGEYKRKGDLLGEVLETTSKLNELLILEQKQKGKKRLEGKKFE